MKYRAEVYDILQYFHRAVFEPSLRCVIGFTGHIDEQALTRAVTRSSDTIPMIRCCFEEAPRGSCWVDQGFTGEDIVSLIEAGLDPEEQKAALLASHIDIFHQPQLKIFIMREKHADTLIIIMNHMVSDGAGFKEYLYLLGDLYTRCKNNRDIEPAACLSRSVKMLWVNFRLPDKLKILLAAYRPHRRLRPMNLGLEGDKTSPLMISLPISGKEFRSLKTWAKEQGVSVNDVIFTAFIRILNKKTGVNRIAVPCPVDLRKYLPADRRQGITNLTSYFISDVLIEENDSFAATVREVSKQMKQQKSSTACLKPILLFSMAAGILPLRALKKIFDRLFIVPLVSFSNLGVLDAGRLRFGDLEIAEAYIGGSIKYPPYFQITATSYQGTCVLSCNFYGTPGDKEKIHAFLQGIREELSACCCEPQNKKQPMA